MAVFPTADDLYKITVPFLQSLTTNPEVGPKFVAANTSFRVTYHDPDAMFVLNATQDPAQLMWGDEAMAFTPELFLRMSGDDGHQFWLGKLNIPIAVAKRKLKVEGPITKLMGMLPAIQPAFGLYRAYLADNGHQDLL
jgi:hypothetical protein